MEYREPPRIAAAERRLDGVVDDPNPRPRLHRFEFVHARRPLDSPRLALAILIAMAVVALLGYLVIRFSTTAIDWLDHQPEFELPFADIELQPPPPEWFRGGKEAFLKQVREGASESAVLHLLELPRGELDKDQIAIDFKKFPWVKDVPRVEYPPHSIRVHLVYRTPVAWMHFPPGSPVYLDEEACVLAVENVDLSQVGRLILIKGSGLERASPDNRPGLPWRSAPEADSQRLAESLKDAAALAGFLRAPARSRASAAAPPLRMIRIEAADPRGLWLENAEHAMILWGDAPGKENPGSLKAAEKWAVLQKWAGNPARHSLPVGDYWQFSHSELIATETR